MEKINKSFAIKTLDSDESKAYSFEGYLSTFGNIDRTGDLIEKEAFNESLKETKRYPMLFNHDVNTVIGYLELSTDESGLKAKGHLTEGVEKAEEVYKLMKAGALDKMSIGMMVKDYETVDDGSRFGWNIKQAEIFEGSIVTIPANNEAKISTVKKIDPNLEVLKAKTLWKMKNTN